MMPRALLLTLTLLASGCATSLPAEAIGPSGEAVCAGLHELARRHASALLDDGGSASARTGADLLRGLDAACLYDDGTERG
ncbi:hypothetical protein [Neomegalonema sp.]|uniref:hypothetical protein n=1 Tax=Neomegalonema sp. TaxID=2039713 RepID=UPI00260C3ED8|nr:hypothetical protein [Neomegalonema sp.]MDD2870100.1 hypothetical protein [Neomegalonema sp.]